MTMRCNAMSAIIGSLLHGEGLLVSVDDCRAASVVWSSMAVSGRWMIEENVGCRDEFEYKFRRRGESV